MNTIENMPDVFHSIINQLDVGICLLDHSGRVAMTNSEFDRQSRSYDAFKVFLSNRLRSCLNTDGDQIDFLKSGSLPGSDNVQKFRNEVILFPRENDSIVLCLEFVPVLGQNADGTPEPGGAILISRDRTYPKEIDLGLVQQVYSSFTAAELQIIELIFQGLTNAEIATRRCRSVMTVNSQVKSILEKSGMSNRTQLVRLLGDFAFRATPGTGLRAQHH